VIRREMLGAEALELILDRLPGFRSHVDDIAVEDDGSVLLHLVMGDLGRYYMGEARTDEQLRPRFWATVEELAASGGNYVPEAVHSSLVEWFAWGSDEEKQALVRAYALLGPETRRMVRYFARDLPDLPT
jgi:hypothetical protein